MSCEATREKAGLRCAQEAQAGILQLKLVAGKGAWVWGSGAPVSAWDCPGACLDGDPLGGLPRCPWGPSLTRAPPL